MARRKKGRRISGWVIIDKPAGVSSNAVVNKVRWAFDAQKAGHAGTLDPEATGLLAVALGEATKTIPYVTDALKAYEFTVRLGQATNTDDAEGVVINSSDKRPSTSEIEAALPRFIGEIEQVPPKFSAVKVDGQRSYALARSGEDVELEARPLIVDRLEVIDRPDDDHVNLKMVCGKGGYVRSIARDLGQSLGCFGHVLKLRRIWSGPFDLEGALDFSTIEEHPRSPELDSYLQPITAGLVDLPEAKVTAEGAMRLQNGNPGEVAFTSASFGDIAWASHQGQPIAIGQYLSGELHPTRVFRL
ncbi:MAG: tRNA pseudouridine(55) synthase TruB [Boseongicola sp.]|nr:tRNA pseudouridine(55) synthase TruB [Boseongicola sp.]MDD9976654.1 tRNA pseudouridine(55) synthase TruB [Boseongicola sp.]